MQHILTDILLKPVLHFIVLYNLMTQNNNVASENVIADIFC